MPRAKPEGFFISDKTRAARVLDGSKYSSISNNRFDQSRWKEDYSFVKGDLAQFTWESKKCNSVMYKNFIHVAR